MAATRQLEVLRLQGMLMFDRSSRRTTDSTSALGSSKELVLANSVTCELWFKYPRMIMI